VVINFGISLDMKLTFFDTELARGKFHDVMCV